MLAGLSGREFVGLFALGFLVFVFGLFVLGRLVFIANKHLFELQLHDDQKAGGLQWLLRVKIETQREGLSNEGRKAFIVEQEGINLDLAFFRSFPFWTSAYLGHHHGF